MKSDLIFVVSSQLKNKNVANKNSVLTNSCTIIYRARAINMKNKMSFNFKPRKISRRN